MTTHPIIHRAAGIISTTSRRIRRFSLWFFGWDRPRAQPYQLPCPHCQEPMHPTTRTTGTATAFCVACIFLLLSIIICASFFPFGLLLGLPMLLCSLRIGGRRESYWLCPRCRSKIPRG
jgi:hypothetical protein